MSYWDIQYQELKTEVESLVDQLRNLDEDERLEKELRCVIDFDVNQFKEKIYAFLNENREASNQAKVCKTLKSIRNAVGCLKKAISQGDGIGRSLVHSAQNLLVSCRHPFEDACRSADRFSKKFKNFERQQELRRTEDILQHPTIHLSDNYQMREIRSVARLMDVGKALVNCAEEYEEACDRISRVTLGEVKLYVVEKDNAPVYLLQFNTNDRKISDFSVHGDNLDELVISYELAMEILTTLDINGDEVQEFIRVGAFSKFKNGRPKTAPFIIDGKEMWKWRIQDELIIAVDANSDGELHWSRFKLPFRNCRWNRRGPPLRHELGVEELLDLLFQNPDLLEHLREPAIDCCLIPRRLRDGPGVKALIDS